MADMTAPSVKVEGNPVCNQQSNFKISKGDAPGSCAGIMSGSIGQMAEFITCSCNVMIEGIPAVRNGDSMVCNCQNTGPQPLNQPPAGDADAGTAKAPAKIEDEYSQQFDFSNLIGYAPGETNILERPTYEIWTKQGKLLCTGTLDKTGLTGRAFTPEKTDVIVYIGQDEGEWRIFGDADHGGRHEEGDEQHPRADITHLVFYNFASAHLTELEYKLVAGDQTITGKTDGNGAAQPLKDLKPGTEVEVWVQKELTKEYKKIGSVLAMTGETTYAVYSPKIKAESSTEKHKGDAAAAPKPATPKAAQKPAQIKTPPQESNTEVVSNAGGNPLAKLAEDDHLALLTSSGALGVLFWMTGALFGPGRVIGGHPKLNPRTSASEAAVGTPLSDENSKKLHTLIDYAEKQVRFDFADYQIKNHYGATLEVIKQWEDAGTKGFPDFGQGDDNEKEATQCNGRCLTYVKMAHMHADVIEGLLEAQEPQNGKGGSIASLAKDSGKDWEKFGYTKVNDLPTVEITYVHAYSEEDAAKVKKPLALQDEINQLNTDIPKLNGVIHKLDHEIKGLNDKLSTAKSAAQKTELNGKISKKNREKEAKENEKEAKENRKEQAEKELKAADTPAKQDRATYAQPDLTRTLPGDLIVYKLVDPITEANPAGHIDIRTYHGFYADFTSQMPLPGLGRQNTGFHRFAVIGVYRKISDTMAMARVDAFLRIIREYVAGETSLSDEERSYTVLKYDKDDKANPFVRIPKGELDNHPFSPQNPLRAEHLKLLARHEEQSHSSPPSDPTHSLHGKKKAQHHSSSKPPEQIPAGAYQITYNVWNRAIVDMGWPRNFEREMQERVAMYQLQSTPDYLVNDSDYPRRSALGYIMEGKVEQAVNDPKLKELYPFLPGGKNEQLNMKELTDKFEKYQKV